MQFKDVTMYSGTEEQYREQFPDTNTNDNIQMAIFVNGKLYFRSIGNCINSQQEFENFQRHCANTIGNLKLTNISRFRG